MKTIKIDNTKYKLDDLSQEAKAQINSINFVDSEIKKLQSELEVYQTARNAYTNTLGILLPQDNKHR